MAVVAAAEGIGEDAGGEIVVVPPSQDEGGGEGVGDVAGGGEAGADDGTIGKIGPTGKLGRRDPVGRLLENRLPQSPAPADADEDPHEGIGGGENVAVFVRQVHMLADDCPQVGVAVAEGRHERRHRHEPADVFVADAAVDRLAAMGEVREEVAVVFLDVGVAMAPRAAHEGDVLPQPAFGVPVPVALYQCR